jgi:hypothetical protein
MAVVKPEVCGNEQQSRKFRRLSPILLDIYVAGIIAEHLVHNGTCEIQNGGKTGSNYNFGHIIDTIAISKANTTFSRVADTMERRPILNDSCV